MSVMLGQPGRKDEVRTALHERGVQTTTMYTGVHEFTAYRERFPGVSLPRTELASKTQFNLPLFPHMTEKQLDSRRRHSRRGALDGLGHAPR